MAEQEERKRADVAREYRDEHIAVYWAPRYCIHTANCLNAEPDVFDAGRRPWVMLEGVDADRVAEAVMTCPTGALTFERLDGGPQEEPLEGAVVMPRTNGPLFVLGKIRVVDAKGDVTREANRAALCRCGGSENKPYCDGTHRVNGFRG